MANVDAPFGFRQVGGLGSRPTSEGTSKYVIKSGYTGAIYAGDIVEFGAGTGEGGNAIDCSEDTLVGLGLINNKGVFKKTEFGLERFDTTLEKGKGKSKAIEITDLFKWSGVLCDPSLDTSGPLGVPDGILSLDDFPLLTEAIIEAALDPARADLLWPTDPHSDSFDDVISEAEFTAYLSTLAECEEFTEKWIFIIADIVRYGLDYVSNGASLTQMRFYPVATTEFT